MPNLVPNDHVNGESVLKDVFAFRIGDFVSHTEFQAIVWFVFHAVGTGHDVVTANTR